jgi:hypothetical protein
MQGVCTALELADRGADVEIIDRGAGLMTGAAISKEGKIHLGYVHAGDRSLATARRMIEGAIVFAPLIRHWLGSALDEIARSDGFVYAVHRRSQLTADEVQLHLQRCTALKLIGEGKDLVSARFKHAPDDQSCRAARVD